MAAGDRVFTVPWHVREARLSAFFAEPVEPSAETASWWETAWKEAPERSELQPRASKALHSGVVTLASGQALVELSIDPLRADWRIKPVPIQSDLAPSTAEFIGSQSMSHEFLAQISATWLESAPPIKRLAFGETLFHPVDQVESTALLSSLTGVDIGDTAGDFILRLNRPRLSMTVEGLQLNRLVKWSASEIRLILVAVTGRNAQALPTASIASGIQVDLDINSDATRETPIDSSALTGLSEEFATMAVEIAERGLER